MKRQINPTIKAHLIRGAFYLLLLLAVCAIPFALAQRNPAARKVSRTAFNRNSALAPASAFRAPAAKLPSVKGRNGIVRKLLAHVPLFTYMIDDGMAEDSVGLTAGGSLVALNEFPVTGGNNVITSISIAWGTPAFPDPSLNGLPYTAVLWSDPNGDGSPTDAVVLAQGSRSNLAGRHEHIFNHCHSSDDGNDGEFLCRVPDQSRCRSIPSRLG